MSKTRIELSGKRFDLLVVLYCVGSDPRKELMWACACDCGGKTDVRSSDLRSGNTGSCGCRNKAALARRCTTHGASRRGQWTPEYRAWASAKVRCYNPNYYLFHRYGGRGISMCERWKNSFANFYEDMGKRPHGRSLDRTNNDGNYEPGNCRWATRKQQAQNRKLVVPRKLSDEDVREIKKLLAQGIPVRTIAAKFKVHTMGIYYHKWKRNNG